MNDIEKDNRSKKKTEKPSRSSKTSGGWFGVATPPPVSKPATPAAAPVKSSPPSINYIDGGSSGGDG